MIGVMEQSVIISFSLPADLLVGLGHAAKAAGRSPADHLRALLRQMLGGGTTLLAHPQMDWPSGEVLPPKADDTPQPVPDSDTITSSVLAALRQADEAAPPVPQAETVEDDDHVLHLVRSICAEAALEPADDADEAQVAEEPVPAAEGTDPVVSPPEPESFGPMTYGILAARGGARRPLTDQEQAEAGHAEQIVSTVGQTPLSEKSEDGSSQILLAPGEHLPALPSALPAMDILPDMPSVAHLQQVIKASPGWLDLQRCLRRDGLVLRLSDCGRHLLLHSWPDDRMLMPVEALGLSLEGLCLHFRAPFPGGGGLGHVLRALVAEDRGPGRAA